MRIKRVLIGYQTSYVNLSNLKVCSNVDVKPCSHEWSRNYSGGKYSACTNLVKFNFYRLFKTFVRLKIQFQAFYVCQVAKAERFMHLLSKINFTRSRRQPDYLHHMSTARWTWPRKFCAFYFYGALLQFFWNVMPFLKS